MKSSAVLILMIVFVCGSAMGDTLTGSSSPTVAVSSGFSYTNWYNSYYASGGISGSTGAPYQSNTTGFSINLGLVFGSFTDGTLSLSGLSSGSFALNQNNHNWLVSYSGSFLSATAGSASMALGGNGSYALTPDMLGQIGAGNVLMINGSIFVSISDAGGGAVQTGSYYQPISCYNSYYHYYYQCAYYSETSFASSGSYTFQPTLNASADLTRVTQTETQVPEPAAIMLLASGLAGLWLRRPRQ